MLFADLQTQWRMGPSGATGLDYTTVLALIDRIDATREERDRLFRDIRVMEGEAITTMRET